MTEFAASGSSTRSLGAFYLLECTARFDEEQDAGLGQSNGGSFASGQQPGAQLRFKLLHLGAEGGLGDVHSVRCLSEMEIFRDRHEIAQLPCIEHRKPSAVSSLREIK
jgi:hypothetical protein